MDIQELEKKAYVAGYVTAARTAAQVAKEFVQTVDLEKVAALDAKNALLLKVLGALGAAGGLGVGAYTYGKHRQRERDIPIMRHLYMMARAQ